MAQVQCQSCGAMTSNEGATCQSCGSPLSGGAPSPFPTPVVGGHSPTQQPMSYARPAEPQPMAPPPPPPPQPMQAPPPAWPPQSQVPPSQPGAPQAGGYPPQAGYPPPQGGYPGQQAPYPPPPGAYPPAPAPYLGGTPTVLLPAQQMAKDVVPLRIVSLIIDFVIIGVALTVFGSILFFVGGLGFFQVPFGGLLALLYFMLMESTRGQTIGKMVLGLKVVKENMAPITMNEAVIRAVDIFLWGITFGIVALVDLILVLDNGQRLGDRWAHTCVIKVQ